MERVGWLRRRGCCRGIWATMRVLYQGELTMLENGSAVGDNLSYVSLSSLDSSCGHLSNFLDRTENPMSSSYNAESTFASLHSLLQTFTRLSMTRRVSLRSLLSSSKQNLDCFFQRTLSSFSFFYHPYSPFIIFVPLSPVCLPGINSYVPPCRHLLGLPSFRSTSATLFCAFRNQPNSNRTLGSLSILFRFATAFIDFPESILTL